MLSLDVSRSDIATGLQRQVKDNVLKHGPTITDAVCLEAQVSVDLGFWGGRDEGRFVSCGDDKRVGNRRKDGRGIVLSARPNQGL